MGAALASAVLIACLLAGDAPAGGPASHPFLWRVERHGNVSHLFGAVHVGIDDEQALGPAGLATLRAARRIFVETDPSAFDELMDAALRRAEMPPDRSLRVLLRADVWRRLAALHGGSFTPMELERLEPWFVTLWTLPQVLEARPMPGVRRGAPPLDAAIATRAAARGAAVSPLESPVEHLAAFSAMGRTEAVAMLEEIVADPEAMRDETDRLVAAYAHGDERVVRKVVGRLVRRRPVLAEYLLWRRNARWRDKLDLWLPDGGVFVAVGAGHMYGDRGLVALLRARGYRVAPARSPATAPASPVPPPRH